MQAFLRKLFGGGAAAFARKHASLVAQINRHGEQLDGVPLDKLAARIAELRNSAKEFDQKTGLVDELLPEVFAIVREAATQTIGLRHFDEQLLGGIALAKGMIAEMKTGEGKTLVATLPATLAAVRGLPAHVVTVNDYLAERDANWMQPVYAALGLDVGVSIAGKTQADKRTAYAAAVTYGTNSQFGFDYLNDNMITEASQRLQRGLGLVIVDEVDSILIDEARTPLGISGIAADLTPLYLVCDQLAKVFVPGEDNAGEITNDFAIDERSRQIHFSDAGYEKAEKVFAERNMLHDGGLYEAHNLNLMHHLVAALRANYLYARDRDYVVKDEQVIIVDEHSGRLMPGRRWSEGMHQAVEAKEKVNIEPETQTFASVSLQNFYRLYQHLAGMTGTAITEAEEFAQIYALEVAEIPTHRPMVRDDQIDRVFARRDAKLTNIVADIADCHTRQQPVLVGTTSIEASEELAALLTKANIHHELLNAKHHQREAQIIAQAGMPGRVTISTSMAGRGTDIVLGGNVESQLAELEAKEEITAEQLATEKEQLQSQWQQLHDQAVAAGGLRIIGTERHESRRIDNQLRGRSGRQGDPGSSVFYLSFEDPLLRVFTDQRFGGLIEKLMEGDDEPLEVGMVSRVIEKAQTRVESHYFDIRKQLLEYDDIANDQRLLIYEQRRAIVDSDDISGIADEFATSAVENLLGQHMALNLPEEEWDAAGATRELQEAYGQEVPLAQWLAEDENLQLPAIYARVTKQVITAMNANLERLQADDTAKVQRALILEVIDRHWRAHLSALDHLRQGIGLRGFAQKNPKQEYRREALGMFNTMLDSIRHESTRILLAVRRKEEADPPPAPPELTQSQGPQPQQATPPPPPPAPSRSLAAKRAKKKPPSKLKVPVHLPASVGRNEPCPCGSGKKYKQCCYGKDKQA